MPFPLKNTQEHYGWVSILLHWLSALFILGLFVLGFVMVELDYYSPWYHRAPFIHKSLGVIFTFLLITRIIWRVINLSPKSLSKSTIAQVFSHGVHISFYFLLSALVVSGYLIASANNNAIEVFNWFSLPGFNVGINNQEDVAGKIHEILGWIIIILASFHGGMAFIHHFIHKDATLKRMVGL